MTKMLKAKGAMITDAGLILKVESETATRIRTEIVGLFFPVHETRTGHFQVSAVQQEWLQDSLVGQKKEFWRAGSRAGMELCGRRQLVDDWMQPLFGHSL